MMKKSESKFEFFKTIDIIRFSIPDCDGRKGDEKMMKAILESLEMDHHYSYARSIVYPNYHEFTIPAQHKNYDRMKSLMIKLLEDHPMKEIIIFRRYDVSPK